LCVKEELKLYSLGHSLSETLAFVEWHC